MRTRPNESFTGRRYAVSAPGGGGQPGRVRSPLRGRVPGVRTAVAGDVAGVVVVPDELARIVQRLQGVAGPAVAHLRTEGRVLGELAGAVVGFEVELEVVVPDVVAGNVCSLE